MTTYYLIRGDSLLAIVDTRAGDVLALPLLCGGDAMSLMSKEHADNLMSNLGLTKAEALAALGIADMESAGHSAIFVGPNPVGTIGFTGVAYHLVDVGPRSLWQVVGQPNDLLALHTAFYALSPENTLGVLAIVQEYGVSFYPAAVRALVGMSIAEALSRRNRIADLLEGLGFDDTAALRAATTEHTQMLGIATALGRTEAQLWDAMVA